MGRSKRCMNKDCDKDAGYGYKNGSRLCHLQINLI